MFRHLVFALALPFLTMAGECLTTLPTAPVFTPPTPYLEHPAAGTFWYGNRDLWIRLPETGVWPLKSDGIHVNKLIFWRQGYDWHQEAKPSLVLTAHRIDGDAPSAAIGKVNSVFVSGGRMPPAMMVGIGIPGEGCWQITAQYKGATLDFVVAVRP